MCGSEIGWGCFPLSLGETRGVKKLPGEGLLALMRESEQEKGVGLNRRLGINVVVADTQGHLICPFLMDEGGATWPVPPKSQGGLREKEKKKKRKGEKAHFMERMSEASFLFFCADSWFHAQICYWYQRVFHSQEWKTALRRETRCTSSPLSWFFIQPRCLATWRQNIRHFAIV